jgi:apolipoprotein N-acyltransferase
MDYGKGTDNSYDQIMIRFMRSHRVLRGFILVWLASFVTIAIAWYGLTPMQLPMHLITMAVGALIGSLPFLADRLLAPRLQDFSATLVYPLAVTAVEFISVTTNSLGSFGAQAYSQYHCPTLVQLVSITGMCGLTFLIGWFAALVNWAWERSFAWPEIKRGVLLYAGVLGLVLAYGSVRLAFSIPQGGTVRVASFTATELALDQLIPLVQSDREAFRRATSEIHDRYFKTTISEARAGAKIILWPEGAGIGVEEDESDLIARGQEAARQEGIYLAMPLFTIFLDPNRPFENKLLIVDPAGEVVLEHFKYGGSEIEGSLRGDAVLRTVETPYGTLSGAICWDADFPAVVRQAGGNGTDILLTPSHDWRVVDPLHSQMAVFRAIENGVSVVRQAEGGLSIATDPYGRVVAQVDHFTASERVMVAQVPTKGVTTVYSVIGDLCGWLSVVGFVAVAVCAAVRWRRARRAGVPQ